MKGLIRMYFGLDKTVVKNIGIKSVDLEHLEKLMKDQEIKFIRSKINVNNHVEYLQIIDEHFGILTSGYKINSGKFVPYMFISINKPRIESNNLVPQSVETFRSVYLKGLQDYIRKAYRLELDFSGVKFETMEINCTFALDEEYSKYKAVFEAMMDNAPKTYKYRQIACEHGKKEDGTHYIENNSIKCKIYNKQVELEAQGNNYNMSDKMCRIEYTLKDSKKIEAVFGTSKVDDITSEQIRQFFLSQFEKDFVKPMEKALKQQKKQMVELLKEKQGISKQYINKVAVELAVARQFFDVELYAEAIKKVDKKNGRRTVANFKKELKIADVENNIARLEEVKEKVFKIKELA